jgi:menaquinone reductase, molybdopterin-binding-like subunit
MSMNRRDAMKLAGGSALGLLFTPAPWKLLDDTAIWTQNWSWTPKLPHGEMSVKYTTCTLCPAACGMEARCCAGVPYQVAGVAGHPASAGALCAPATAAHHLAYVPGRARQVLRSGKPAKFEDLAAAAGEAQGAVAIWDRRPGRTQSEIYQRWAKSMPGGMYLATPPPEARVTDAVRRLAGDNRGYGIDWENVKTVLSFGAPLLDGWGAPGRMWQARAGFYLIQADTGASATADLANAWLPLKPGTEAELALAVAHVLLREQMYDPAAERAEGFTAFRQLAATATPEMTGLAQEQIEAAARRLAQQKPAVAVGGGDAAGGPLSADAETAIAALNVLLGSVGRKGGYVARRDPGPNPVPGPESAADGSIGVLILDEAPGGQATPWETIRPKLKRGAVVVSLSSFPGGIARHAEWVVPAPAFLETMQEAPTPTDGTRAMFALAPPLLAAPQGAITAEEFLNRMAAARGWPKVEPLEGALKVKAQALFASKRGALFTFADGGRKTAKDAGEFWKLLLEGACWMDEDVPAPPPGSLSLPHRLPVTKHRPVAELALITSGWKGESSGAPVSPLVGKMYQESGLKPAEACIALNPETGRANGLVDGGSAILRTECGDRRMRVDLDESVAPGVVEASGPPPADVMDLCRPQDGCSWRFEPASVRRA